MPAKGTVDQLPSGRWRLRVSVDGHQQSGGTYATEADAWHAAKVAAEVDKETKPEHDGDTVEEFGRAVLTRREVKHEVRDPDKDWSRWRNHIVGDELGDMSVKRVRPEHAHRWMRRLEAKDLATTTLRACRSLLSVVLDDAVANGLLKLNPARGLKIRGGNKPLPWTYLNYAEQVAVLRPQVTPDRHILAVSIGTGVRAGELACLRLADLHMGDAPHVVVRYGTPPDVPTKTGQVRTVPLFGWALAALREWLPLLPAYCPDNPHGLVFPRERGGFRHPDHILPWATWKAILDAAGIARRFRWHDLRHTCASSLVSGFWGRRWSLQEVKEMLGHTSIQVTQRYAHLAASAIQQAGSETIGVDTASHGFIHTQPHIVLSDIEKTAVKQLAPPGVVETPTNALGRPCNGPNGARILGNDYPVTSVGSSTSGDPPSEPPNQGPAWLSAAVEGLTRQYLNPVLGKSGASCASALALLLVGVTP